MSEYDIIKEELPLRSIDINDGQIDGVPKNPRTWTYIDMERLKTSISQTPELLKARGIIVFPLSGRFVAIGGNMRLTALRALGWENAPCIVLPADMSIDKIKQIAIKDNGSFGYLDEQLLIEDWGNAPLEDWGIEAHTNDNTDSVTNDKAPSKITDKVEFSVIFNAYEFEFVQNALREIDPAPEQALLYLISGNQNEK